MDPIFQTATSLGILNPFNLFTFIWAKTYLHSTSTYIVAASEVPTVLLAVQLYDPDLPLCMFGIV